MITLHDFLIYLSAYVGLFAVTYYFLSFLAARHRIVMPLSEDDLPSVSIIIPAYNEEGTIVDTINSALNLDYPKDKLEIFVIDDGSKDNTYLLSRSIKDSRLKVFHKENQGKASAINFGLNKIKSQIVVTMDADTFARPDSLRKMVRYFSNDNVMCVTPSMMVHDPKSILQRIQQIEYFIGIYLRKAFATMNAIHVTPGAFSAYRKSFFDKYGGFDTKNLTEDMEVALRIQYNNYKIECSEDALVETSSPKTFWALFRQRKRWYYGWIKNMLTYKELLTKRYGELGFVVLPTAVVTILLAIILTFYIVFNTLFNLFRELSLFQSVNFNFSYFSINQYFFERYLFILFTNPKFLILLVFLVILSAYMAFAKRKAGKYHSNIRSGMFFFLLFYGLLFTFWWTVSIFYSLFNKKVGWGKQ